MINLNTHWNKKNEADFEINWTEKCKKDIPKYNYPMINRVIVIGDIHGDFNILIEFLKLANVIDCKNKWNGGNTYVIQLGDQIDRYRPSFISNKKFSESDEHSDIKILYYLNNLNDQAIKSHGRVISLLGNHEIMNVDGNMDYVSYQGLINFSKKNLSENDKIINGIANRRLLFSPGQKFANMLACSRSVSVIIGKTLFVHAALLENIFSKYNIKDINNLMTLYLFKLLDETQAKHYNNIYNSEYSPLWSRQYASINTENDCNNIFNNAMSQLNIERIIVGHTVLENNKRTKCNNRIIFADCYASKAFDTIYNMNRKKFIIEIINDTQINFLELIK